MKKLWYNVVLVYNDNTEEVVAKVKSKGLAYNVVKTFNKLYKNTASQEKTVKKIYVK